MKFKALVSLLTILFMVLTTLPIRAEMLPEQVQRNLIEAYGYVTGQRVLTQAASEDLIESNPYLTGKCGTPVMIEFWLNQGRIDRTLQAAMGVQLLDRPNRQYYHDSPSGHFRIHFDMEGPYEVYESDVDSDGDGIPNYVESVALIADSCWNNQVNNFGFDPPLTDTLCADGGTTQLDIYLTDLAYGYYGYTVPEASCGNTTANTTPAWMALDTDYQHLPEYANRVLDAVRVTLAHELLHTSHLAMDGQEAVPWLEMTSVWMEEMMYDDINDYYLNDSLFYNYPGISIQDSSVTDTVVAHEYASAVWPIFLGEKYGDSLIPLIWHDCADRGPGPHYLISTDAYIDSVTKHYVCTEYTGSVCTDSALVHQSLNTAFAEFAVWNYFTGPFASAAPDTIGFEEAENYSYIPNEKMDIRRDYGFGWTADEQYDYRPQINAATYLRLENLETIEDDSVLSFFLYSQHRRLRDWGVSAIYQDKYDLDSHIVRTITQDYLDTIDTGSELEYDTLPGFYIESIFQDSLYPSLNTSDYNSITLVITPTSTNPAHFGFYDPADYALFNQNASTINTDLANIPPAVLKPYPNPCVLEELEEPMVNFQFQMATDSTGYPVFSTAYLEIDLFNVAGEYIRTLTGEFLRDDRLGEYRTGLYTASWNLRNQAENDVASGVYLARARLFQNGNKHEVLAEDKVKLALIR